MEAEMLDDEEKLKSLLDMTTPTGDPTIDTYQVQREDVKNKLTEIMRLVLSDLIDAGEKQTNNFESAIELSRTIGFYDCRILMGKLIIEQQEKEKGEG